ncbi:MAG: tRNA pseudouridine(55) synthase TruB [Bacilli bacterium]|nr:tRNA pseudouridine(55) synthase TruB [Bacilli bacterium]
MNGILVINKEKDYTSRDVVNIVSKELNTKKVGHTGTLDPIATGVLVLCIGKCLKLSELLTSNDKEYIAKVKLGVETDTLDITGTITYRKENISINKEDIINCLKHFKGKIKQEVPKYSAVKVNGKKLYEYARKNQEVKLPIKEVEIHSLELISDIEDNEFYIKCNVSKGTYIRSLIRDIGRYLNTYATMTELTRIRQGLFTIENSFTLEDIKSNKYKLLNPKDVIDLPKKKVDDYLAKKIKNGMVLPSFFNEEKAIILDKDDNLLAIYKHIDDNKVKPYKML